MKSTDKVDRVKSALRGVDDVTVDARIEGLLEAAPSFVNSHTPDVLLVELGLDDPDEIDELATFIEDKKGEVAVVATAENASLEGIRRLMRLGVADFIPQPISQEDIMNAFDAAVRKLPVRAPARGKESRVFTFMRASGGAGATTLAIQSAAELVTFVKRQVSKVCILDFDLQFGNVALALDIVSETNVEQIIEADGRLDDALISSALVHHQRGIDVLATPSGILPLEALTPDMVNRIIAYAKRNYDYVVIDMPFAWTSWTTNVLMQSDAILMVSELDVVSISRARRQFNLLRDHGLDYLPIHFVVNRYANGWFMRGRRKDAEKGIGRQIDFLVHNDFKTAAEARNRGVLMVDVRRGSKIVKDVQVLLSNVLQMFRREETVLGI